MRMFYIFVIGFAVSIPLKADHNMLLQKEFRAGINRHVVSDNDGYCYLLLPTGRSDGKIEFTLKVSQKPHPREISDFSAALQLPKLKPGAGERMFVKASKNSLK